MAALHALVIVAPRGCVRNENKKTADSAFDSADFACRLPQID
jgi:hypothetical protein